jgi:hypothetical protein
VQCNYSQVTKPGNAVGKYVGWFHFWVIPSYLIQAQMFQNLFGNLVGSLQMSYLFVDVPRSVGCLCALLAVCVH